MGHANKGRTRVTSFSSYVARGLEALLVRKEIGIIFSDGN